MKTTMRPNQAGVAQCMSGPPQRYRSRSTFAAIADGLQRFEILVTKALDGIGTAFIHGAAAYGSGYHGCPLQFWSEEEAAEPAPPQEWQPPARSKFLCAWEEAEGEAADGDEGLPW